MIELIQINADNIEQEHICCALGAGKEAQHSTEIKKDWMRQQFDRGYHFCRADVRGKVFIEYTPAQNAWAPVQADDWLFLDCFWVSGQYKKQGLANRLLQTALEHAAQQGMAGLCAVSTLKKRSFISDAGFYMHKGFVVADEAPPDFLLLARPLREEVALPAFGQSVKNPPPQEAGFSVYYTDHCPHTSRYAELLQEVAEGRGVSFHLHRFTTAKEAQKAPNPFTTWSMYWEGTFLTNEIYSPEKLEKLIDKMK